MNIKMSALFIVAIVSLSACNLGASQSAEDGTGTEATEAPALETQVAEPTVEATATVEHKDIPGEFPETPSGVVGDQDSSITADDNRAPSGDRFTFTRFERPFNSETMDEYYPFIDIQEGVIYMDDNWIYVAIALKSDEASRELKGRYGVEIDLDLDGGGDWLILASNPVSTDWTTDGVEAWFDANDDVGGAVAAATDEKPEFGDGYESFEFGPGVGSDSDLAWVRISSADPNIVHLAMKTDILNGSKRFLAGLWAGEDDLDPSMFDLSDHFTHEQAGAALIELNVFYPIKEISAIDNTCRMAIGFQPTGREPGLCPLPGSVAGEEQIDGGCPPENIVCTIPLTAAYSEPVCVCTGP